MVQKKYKWGKSGSRSSSSPGPMKCRKVMFKKFVAGKGKAYIASHLSSSVGLLLEGKVKWVVREYYS